MRSKPTFDEMLRGTVILVALLAVAFLAVAGGTQIAPLAAGGLLTLLAAGAGYLFRSKLVPTSTTQLEAITLPVSPDPRA